MYARNQWETRSHLWVGKTTAWAAGWLKPTPGSATLCNTRKEWARMESGQTVTASNWSWITRKALLGPSDQVSFLLGDRTGIFLPLSLSALSLQSLILCFCIWFCFLYCFHFDIFDESESLIFFSNRYQGLWFFTQITWIHLCDLQQSPITYISCP